MKCKYYTLMGMVVLLIVCGSTQAKSLNKYKLHQVTLGFGYATSPEKGPFNVPVDTKIEPQMAFQMSYLANIGRNFGVGFRIQGYTDSGNKYVVTDINTSEDVVTEVDFFTGHYGLEGRWTIHSGRIQPYLGGTLNLVLGSAESSYLGNLNSTGYSAGVAGGIGFLVTPSFMISAEANTFIGTSKWDEKPFGNSSDKEFNPSMTSVLVNFSYLWGSAASF